MADSIHGLSSCVRNDWNEEHVLFVLLIGCFNTTLPHQFFFIMQLQQQQAELEKAILARALQTGEGDIEEEMEIRRQWVCPHVYVPIDTDNAYYHTG